MRQCLKGGVSQNLSCWEPDSTAFYLQDKRTIGERLTLMTAISYDDFEDFENEWLPKAGAMLGLGRNLCPRTNYRHSPRTPRRGGSGTGTVWAVAITSWEIPISTRKRSDAFDTTTQGSGKTWFGRAGYFYNDVDDLIEPMFVRAESTSQPTVMTYRYENIAKAVIQDPEAEASQQATRSLRLGLNNTYLDAEDDITAKRLVRRLKHLFRAKLDYLFQLLDPLLNPRMRYSPAQINVHSDVNDLFDHYRTYLENLSDDKVLGTTRAFSHKDFKIAYQNKEDKNAQNS